MRGSSQGQSPSSAKVRVHKYMSHAGVATRRQAEGLIRQGRVSVNGAQVTAQGVRVRPGVDEVALDGVPVRPAPVRWVVFHKPTGTLCTRSDPHGGATIFHVLPAWALSLRYVGRLDRDTSGLLLLTNDGDNAAKLTHPATRLEREYRVRVIGDVTARGIKALRAGVELEDGFARPRRVRRISMGDDNEWGVQLVLTEGRKREVRRLFKAVGLPVKELVRTRFGPFHLRGLKEGSWRSATATELGEAKKQCAKRSGRSRDRRRRDRLGRRRRRGRG